jgi:Na+-transporting methylmalonyl-CoA/oxaloacetate decarboxylase gamma subunit
MSEPVNNEFGELSTSRAPGCVAILLCLLIFIVMCVGDLRQAKHQPDTVPEAVQHDYTTP